MMIEPFVTEEQEAARWLKSPLPGVDDMTWTRFVLSMKVARTGSVSASGSLGMFELRPRRLADLGVLKNVHPDSGRWVGDFIQPVTQKGFLSSPKMQYQVFVASMREYTKTLSQAAKTAKAASLSGILSIVHRAGYSGVKKFLENGELFPETKALFDKVNWLF